jgi:hypothetical protein
VTDEPVTTPSHRLDIAGILRGIAQSLPQFSHGTVDGVVVIDVRARRPEPVLDLFPGRHLAGVFQQQDQDLQWLVLQLDARSALTQFARSGFQLEAPEPVHRWPCLAAPHLESESNMDSCSGHKDDSGLSRR